MRNEHKAPKFLNSERDRSPKPPQSHTHEPSLPTIMSRSSSLRQSLQLPENYIIEVLSVEPSGDCFYDSIYTLLSHEKSTPNTTAHSTPPLLRKIEGVNAQPIVPSSQSLRDYVADQLTSEQFELYQMFASAGVEDFAWMSSDDAPRNLHEIKNFARRSGKNHGPGKCMWADEFALRTISEGCCLTLLIIDEQAARSGGSGRKRRRVGTDAPSFDNSSHDGRYISIGVHPRAVILHRSRRQHYNAVVINNCPILELNKMPEILRLHWPLISPSNHEANLGKSNATSNPEKACSNHANDVVGTRTSSEWENNPSHQCINPDPAKTALLETFPDLEKNKPEKLGQFYCGCAGFSSSKWVGNIYPKSIVGHNSDRQLDHYQQFFSTVEINSTFYGIPTESTVKKWKQQFAKSFKVVVKAPKGLTHENDHLDCSVLTFFLSRMQPLGENLACILIQCPRSLSVDVQQLQRLKTALDEEASWYNGYLAFEFRNEASFNDEKVREFLKANCKWTLVIHPNSLGRSTIGTSASGRGISDLAHYEPEKLSIIAARGVFSSKSKFVYLRLHGCNDEHTGEYTIEQLKEIAIQIYKWRRQGLDVYAYILNDLEPTQSVLSSPKKVPASKMKVKDPWEKWCAMPKNAKQLEKLVYELSNERVPTAPKQQKSTLLNFFGKK